MEPALRFFGVAFELEGLPFTSSSTPNGKPLRIHPAWRSPRAPKGPKGPTKHLKKGRRPPQKTEEAMPGPGWARARPVHGHEPAWGWMGASVILSGSPARRSLHNKVDWAFADISSKKLDRTILAYREMHLGKSFARCHPLPRTHKQTNRDASHNFPKYMIVFPGRP